MRIAYLPPVQTSAKQQAFPKMPHRVTPPARIYTPCEDETVSNSTDRHKTSYTIKTQNFNSAVGHWSWATDSDDLHSGAAHCAASCYSDGFRSIEEMWSKKIVPIHQKHERLISWRLSGPPNLLPVFRGWRRRSLPARLGRHRAGLTDRQTDKLEPGPWLELLMMASPGWWGILSGVVWAAVLPSADTEVTPVVHIRYAPPLLELLLPSFDKTIESVDFRYGLNGLVSQEFSSPANFSATQGWIFTDSSGTTGSEEMVWAYAVIYDVVGKPVKETWRTSAYAAMPRSVSCLPNQRIPGAVLFRDDFNSLEYSKWHPLVGVIGYRGGFQAFVPDDRVNFVLNGKLHIKPMLTTDHPGFSEQSMTSGKMDLFALYGKCHMTWSRGGCVREGKDGFLPPVMSGRLHNVAALRYGILEVRAKLPLGDWLWPAIWLRPRNSPYKGGWPRAGEIDLMESRGNRGSWDVGMVRSAIHWGISGGDRKTVAGRKQGKNWHSQFHIYKMVWTPDYIATYVDSEQIMYLEAGTSMYERGHFRGSNIWASGDKMAPFDQEFYLIMNVAVGGIGGTFTDSRSFSPSKPWRNSSPTAAKDFWDARSDWLASWNGNDAALVVDWVQFRNL
ncbi:hypothetical protein RRG08_032105 [Elysia crispata]|uniref:GH16 domain-containing protein n=1 Tax=Elysia crispata TaxID=231223 RepID=A0AAE1DEY8_9GAST|nr:hypothetical protein RRG08_032105 [Elysia crispata]